MTPIEAATAGGIDLSIIVVSWNTREMVLDCLAAIERERGCVAFGGDGEPPIAVEVIVVDNGSADGSAEAIAAAHPDVRIIALPENRGYAGGNNAALREARGRMLLLLNSDCELESGALRQCLAVLDREPGVGAAGLQLLHPDGRLQNSIHAFPSLLRELIPTALLEWLAPRRFPSKRHPASEPIEVEAVLGAAFFVRREAIERVGPLSEDYFFFLEETDWCWRMREAGLRVLHIPGARAIHRSGASSKQKHPLETRIEFHRSLYHFLRTRRGRGSAAAVMCIRVARNLLLLAPLLLLAAGSQRQRARLHIVWGLVIWHALGCPQDRGLAGASSRAGV